MGLVVTGISQTGDIKALEASLKDAGLPLDPIQLISPDDSTQGLSRGVIGQNLMTPGATGTGVPGLTSGAGNSYGSRGTEYFRNESLSDRLGDLEIPDDEVDNYVEALESGRHVVAYFAKDATLEKVQQLFEASGLAKVKVF